LGQKFKVWQDPVEDKGVPDVVYCFDKKSKILNKTYEQSHQ